MVNHVKKTENERKKAHWVFSFNLNPEESEGEKRAVLGTIGAKGLQIDSFCCSLAVDIVAGIAEVV